MKFFLMATIIAEASKADSCTGAACGESATMLQFGGRDLKSRATGHRKNSVSLLYNSAVQLLREGATPEVVTFSEESLKEISGPIKQAILDAHKSDEQRLAELFPGFQTVLDNYNTYKAQVLEERAKNEADSIKHKTCREDQATLCREHNECRLEEARRWEIYEAKASAFQTVLTSDTEACTNATKDVTKDSIDVFKENLADIAAAGQTIATKWTEHHEQMETCNGIEADHAKKKIEDCDTQQRELEEAICANHKLHELSSSEALSEWGLVSRNWATLTAAVKEEEAIRKNEFIAVHEVECLVQNIRERGGQPCSDKKDDNGNDEADKVISHCRDATVDVGNWTITIADPPAAPVILEDRAFPCTDSFHEEHYASLQGECHEIAACRVCETATES